jgi:tetraacyldisaccharide 4'-kinase
MMFRTPDFWYEEPGLAARLLSPLGWCYGWATARRLSSYTPPYLEVPTICVGNLTAGGGGKTPTTLALLRLLTDAGITAQLRGPVHFLTRGHGGQLAGPVLVEPERHSAALVGDEALLLAAAAPCWVSRDRQAGARAAQDAGAGLILIDDGLQNPAPRKTISILAVKGDRGFGNGCLIPAGPLREEPEQALARIDAIISIGAPTHISLDDTIEAKPCFTAELEPDADDLAALRQGRWVAAAGIADPASFERLLLRSGVDVAAFVPLADHQPLQGKVLGDLHELANQHHAGLVLTEKDYMRLLPAERSHCRKLSVSLGIEGGAELAALIRERLEVAGYVS